PEDQTGRRAAADRGADRSERAALGPVVAVEPARLARAARQPDCDSDRPRAALCGGDLLAGRTQSDARAASGRARAPGSPGLLATFESAMAALFGGAPPTLSAPTLPGTSPIISA